MKSEKLKRKRGFTVLESIVAIFILSLSISGAFSAVQASLSQSIIAKDEIKAFYLAQEAVEMIRNKRDANQLAIISTGSGHWLRGIAEADDASNPCYFGKTCRVDATQAGGTYIFLCPGSWGSCPMLNQDMADSGNTAYMYGYGSGGLWRTTNFKREIQIESINANEIAVTVRVSWTKGVINKEFKAKTHLFNLI